MRFPAELYLDLKREALTKRVSVTSLIHKKLTKKKKMGKKINVEQAMKELAKLAKENAKYLKGISLSDAVIEMRYEQ